MIETTKKRKARRLPVRALAVAAIAVLAAVTLLAGSWSVRPALAQTPDEQLNITVRDAKTLGLLPGSCFKVFHFDPGQGTNIEHDVVGDDVGGSKADCGEPSNLKLFDKDPTAGSLRITIPGAQRDEFGDIWHVLQTRAPRKYSIDFMKHQCDLGLGKCEITIDNTLLLGDILINVTDNETAQLVPNQCADIYTADQTTLIKAVCDGDVNDKDTGAGIRVNVAFGDYSVDLDLTALPPNRVPKQPTKLPCSVANDPPEERECKVAFFLNEPTPTPTPTATPVVVGGISVDPDVGALPAETAQSSGGNAGMLTALVAGATAAAMSLAGAAWYARRRWAR